MRVLDLPLVTGHVWQIFLQSTAKFSKNYADDMYCKLTAQDFFWVELKIKDPGNLKQKTKQYFPVIFPHELFDFLRALRLIQNRIIMMLYIPYIYIYIL